MFGCTYGNFSLSAPSALKRLCIFFRVDKVTQLWSQKHVLKSRGTLKALFYSSHFTHIFPKLWQASSIAESKCCSFRRRIVCSRSKCAWYISSRAQVISSPCNAMFVTDHHCVEWTWWHQLACRMWKKKCWSLSFGSFDIFYLHLFAHL